MKGLVGVDIGSTAVRAVYVEPPNKEGYAVVSKIGIAPLGENAVVAGRIRNPVAVAQALTLALKEGGMAPYGFVLGLSHPQQAIVRMNLSSSVKPVERTQVIRTQRKDITPNVPLVDSALATSFIDTVVSGEGVELDRLVVATALKSEVGVLENVCKLAKATPRAIDLSAVALPRALVRSTPDDTSVHTIVDIGATQTLVVTREGLDLRSVRVVAMGGADITRALQTAMRSSFEDAERMKKALQITGTRSETLRPTASASYGTEVIEEDVYQEDAATLAEEALFTTADNLVDQIAQSVETDATQFETMAQGISLAGGTAHLRGLRESLENRAGIPVVIGQPWAQVAKNKRTEKYFDTTGQVDPAFLESLSVAIGLGLWSDNS